MSFHPSFELDRGMLKIIESYRTGKAFQTSSLPGHTRKFTGTVKVHEGPPVYVYDMAGIMVPYLGKGVEGMERGLKLGLTCESPVLLVLDVESQTG